MAGISRFLRLFCVFRVCFACVSHVFRAFSDFEQISGRLPEVCRARWGAGKGCAAWENGIGQRRESFGRARLERNARSAGMPHILIYNTSIYRHLNLSGRIPEAWQSVNIYQDLEITKLRNWWA